MNRGRAARLRLVAGRRLAGVATEDRIEVYGDTRDEPIYTLPVSTAALGWAGPARSGPGDGG